MKTFSKRTSKTTKLVLFLLSPGALHIDLNARVSDLKPCTVKIIFLIICKHLRYLKTWNHKWYSLSSFSSYKVYLLCAFVSTSSFFPFFSIIQNWNSQSTQYKSLRCTFSQVNCLPRTQAIHVGTKRQMCSWHQWTLEREQLRTVKWKQRISHFFVKKLNTPRHWQVSNWSTKSCEKEGDPSRSKFFMTQQNRTQVFWLLVTMSSPDVTKEVASVAASEPPRPRAARRKKTENCSGNSTEGHCFQGPLCCGDVSSSGHKSEHLPWACFWRKRQRKRKNQWLKSLMWLTIE